MEHTKHIFRIFILAVVVFAAVLIGRMFYVPESWGIFGNYRANDLMEVTGHQTMHGGTSSCIPCHEDKGKNHDEGVHKRLPCEDCHEPLALHVAEGKKIKDMPVYRGTEQCLVCHQRLDARPPEFPQIEETAHLKDQGVDPAPEVCIGCHDPHSPGA